MVVGKPLRWRVPERSSEKWIPVRTLLAVNRDSPYYQEKTRAGMFYAESWILVHMLVLSRDYRPKMREMLEAFKETGVKDEASARALEAAYGKPVEGIEKDLRGYMAATTLAAAVFDAPAVNPTSDVQIDRNAG